MDDVCSDQDQEDLEELEAMMYSQIYYDTEDQHKKSDFIVDESDKYSSSTKDISTILNNSSTRGRSQDENLFPSSSELKVLGLPLGLGGKMKHVPDWCEKGHSLSEPSTVDTSSESVTEHQSSVEHLEFQRRNYPATPGPQVGGKYNSRLGSDLYVSRTSRDQEFVCRDRGGTRGCGQVFHDHDQFLRHNTVRRKNRNYCPQITRPDTSSPVYQAPADSSPTSPVSKYDVVDRKKLVENPFFDDKDSSSSDEDEGILCTSSKADDCEVIEFDSTGSPLSPILITDDEEKHDDDDVDDDLDDGIQIIEEHQTLEAKNKPSQTNKALSDKQKYYREEFGSDFDDNLVTSDDDSDSDDELIIPNKNIDTSMKLNMTAPVEDVSSAQKILGFSLSRVKSKSMSDLPATWTREMDQFYNDVDEEMLDLDLDTVMRSLPADSNWEVDRADLYGGNTRRRSRYFTNKRCNNCNQVGHLSYNCPDPVKVRKCHMCGGAGHTETRCPHRCCLTCGKPYYQFLENCMHCRDSRSVKCHTCGHTGHVSRDCPDTWRRFHATTQGSDPVKPAGYRVEKPDSECWCCNCGRQGHLADTCHKFRYSKHPTTSLRVISYNPVKHENLPDQGLTPSAAVRDEEEEVGKSKKKKKVKTCPNTPDLVLPQHGFSSQPASPLHTTSFLSSVFIAEKAVKKLDKKKHNDVKKAKLMAEMLSNHKPKHMKAKQIKTAISSCMSEKRAETRSKEWREARGFDKKPAKSQGGFTGSRANLIPSFSFSAAKFLQKEIQKCTGATPHSKRLIKDIAQEIMGLKKKNQVCPGSLKKVERKRLADLVLQLRES